ncbi:Crp/Fnr family transcriptional regulator [Phormidium sp. FACHB-322]|uniref:Crp/Fnr family transcriptional regulator n=3 Tax=Cyanophyceae TaxID=3028117 RepID=UPI0016891207|nr:MULTISPECIES: Crp/Fnr family transcriptional regulator [Cyanophyceae]MBD2028854.1 Crp/Fnr family transcriptional regulator [Phormidium sp. FACHB-322]MBD2049242.1 Crp/Fnr family transcriptional regulator [Leptolyngbya sp. FACHB-60]
MQVDAQQLQKIGLFKDLDLPLLSQLATHSSLNAYGTDETVFQEGDALPACLYLLAAGSLRLTKVSESGKETILRLLGADEMFAAPALFGNGQAPATATAMEPIEVLTIKREALLKGFQEAPELALHLLGIFNQRLQDLHNRVHGLVSERAIVRLIHYLEHFAASAGTEAVPDGQRLRSHLTHYQIARSIGITYEECVRLFKQLKGAVVYQRGGKITILDPDKLTAIVQRQVD